MPYLYTPPQWKNVGIFEGSLRYGIPTSYCVYRKSGVWHITQSPAVGELVGIDVDAASGMTLLFDRSKVIPSSLQPELATFSSTAIPGAIKQGTLTLL